MQSRKSIVVVLALLSTASGQQLQEKHFVLLPARAAGSIAKGGTWQPAKADIDGLEARLSDVSALKAENWGTRIGIVHPEQYFRQYVAVVRDGKKLIYVNALCDERIAPDWRHCLVVVNDGATCFWQAFYDPVAKQFFGLRINGRA